MRDHRSQAAVRFAALEALLYSAAEIKSLTSKHLALLVTRVEELRVEAKHAYKNPMVPTRYQNMYHNVVNGRAKTEARIQLQGTNPS